MVTERPVPTGPKSTPREVAAALDRWSAAPGGAHDGRERFSGWGVMGLPFASGHVLGLRRFPVSSIGPGYAAVWHRSPEGAWSFWADVPDEMSCARYTGAIAQETHQASIRVQWPEAHRLLITVDEPDLVWEVTLTSTRATRALTVLAGRLPRRILTRKSVLGLMGPTAGPLLGVGGLALTGTMPNRQRFQIVPTHMWRVTDSCARLEGVDLGRPAPLPAQARLGDFRIPQRGLVAAGDITFTP